MKIVVGTAAPAAASRGSPTPAMTILELIARSITIVALAAAVVLAYLYSTQRSLIYFPGSTSPSGELLPAESQVVELHTADGLRLSGWFLPASRQPSRSGAEPTPGPAILICNGNAGDRSHRLPLAEALTERGYAVLLFDYRGYAGNPGNPSEDGLRADARAAEATSSSPTLSAVSADSANAAERPSGLRQAFQSVVAWLGWRGRSTCG